MIFVNFRVEQKLKKCEQILNSIIFSNITDKQLYSIIAGIFPDEAIRKSHIIYKVILEKKFLSENIVPQFSLVNPENERGMRKAFILVGGICNKGITNDICYRFLDENKWNFLTSIPHVDQCNYGAAVYKNVLYIIGGCYNGNDEEEILHPYAFSFDPKTHKWKTLQSMNEPRCRFTLTLLEDNMYAIGGSVDTGIFPLYPLDAGCNLCHKYTISKNEWTQVASLPKEICQHAACTLELEGHEHIIVSGGLHEGMVSTQVYEYDPLKNMWGIITNLIVGRVDHHMFQYRNKLYVCGGWNYGSNNLRRYLVSTIDVYDPKSNTWHTITQKSNVTYHSAIVINGSKIYFIGGFNYDSEFRRVFEDVECYDIDENSWCIIDDKPPEIWEHNCVMMFVPKNKCLLSLNT